MEVIFIDVGKVHGHCANIQEIAKEIVFLVVIVVNKSFHFPIIDQFGIVAQMLHERDRHLWGISTHQAVRRVFGKYNGIFGTADDSVDNHSSFF